MLSTKNRLLTISEKSINHCQTRKEKEKMTDNEYTKLIHQIGKSVLWDVEDDLQNLLGNPNDKVTLCVSKNTNEIAHNVKANKIMLMIPSLEINSNGNSSWDNFYIEIFLTGFSARKGGPINMENYNVIIPNVPLREVAELLAAYKEFEVAKHRVNSELDKLKLDQPVCMYR